jgi:hypothetical protein
MGPLEQASGKHGCVLEMRLDHRRESTAACCVYEDPKEKNVFSALCYLLPRVLPVSADFVMSSAAGNGNT